MSIVTAETQNLSDALESATKINNVAELKRIIDDLNSRNFSDHKSLIRCIREHVKDLDPFEPDTVVDYILDQIRPELKKLVSATSIILSTSKPKWFQCFRGTRT